MKKTPTWYIVNVVLILALVTTFITIGVNAVPSTAISTGSPSVTPTGPPVIPPILIPQNTTYQELSGGIASDTCPNAILHVAVIDIGGTGISRVVVDVSQVNMTGSLTMYRDGSVVIGNSTALVYSANMYVDKTIRPGGAKSLPVTATDNAGSSGSTDLIIIAFTKMGVNVIGYDSSKAIPAHPANASFFYDHTPVKIIITSIDGTQFTNVTASFASVDGSRSVEYDNSGVLLPDGNYTYDITHTLGTIPGTENVVFAWINVTFSVSTPNGNTVINIPQIGALAVLGNFNPKDDPSTGLGGDTTDWRTIPDYSAAILKFEPVSTASTSSTSSEPTEEWNKTFGGTDLDYGYEVQQTTDGGYVVAGYTGSYPNRNAILIKTTASGNLQWNKNLGVAGYDDGAFSGQQTADGGYILAGWMDDTNSRSQARLVKTDANGDIIWSKTFGGASSEYFYSVRQTADGGFIVAGKEGSTRADYSTYLVKTDANGNEQWSKTTGGTGDGYWSVKQTSDGGYILAGSQGTFNIAILEKTDASGNQQWSKSFGITGKMDRFFSVQQTTDGGYVVAGDTQSYGSGNYDAWLVKTDTNGNEQWSKTFGGINNDCAHSVQQTADGGYILAGWKDITTYGSGNSAALLIKTDSSGTQQWSKTFGGTNDDEAFYVQQTTDGGYIVCGDTYSYSTGQNNVWLTKFSRDTPVPSTGKIATLQFNEPIDLTNYETAMQLKNLGQMLVISGKSMDLNATANALSAFNKAATLTIYNLTAFTMDPGILQNSVLVPSSGGVISNYNWNNSTKTLSFSVGHWTAYSWDGTLPSLYPLAVDYPTGQTSVKSGQSVQLNAEVSDSYSGVLNVTADATSIGGGLISFSNTAGNVWSKTTVVNAADGNYVLTVIAYDNAANRNTGTISVSVNNNATTSPTVTGITPTSGSTAGGTSVTITGTNLLGATAVNFGTPAATGVTVVSATSITATSPAQAVGIVDVTVTTPSGTSAISAADKFTYVASPTNATSTIGMYRNGVYYLRNSNTAGNADLAFAYGSTGDIPVTGDWNGGGITTIGMYRNGVYYLRNSNTAGNADLAFAYGSTGDIPVTGDWNGGGITTIGMYRNGVYYLRNSNTAGNADLAFAYGSTGDIPVTGDWNGDGITTIGMYRNGVYYLRNSNTAGNADLVFAYGSTGDIPVTGDWNGDGITTIGMYRNGVYYLRNTNTAGNADLVFAYGSTGDIPVTGNWV